MAKEETKECCSNDKWHGRRVITNSYNSGGGAVYGIGLIGALVYFLQHSSTFKEVLVAIVKAFIWPGLVAYHVLQYFKL